MSLRLFVGLELPESARERLALLQSGIPDIRWVNPENLHLTLRFIGDTPEPQLPDLVDSLNRIDASSFHLTLSGVGSFGGGKPRAIWAGVETNPELLHLQEKVERAVQTAGFDPEQRKFTPHVTLARVKRAKVSRVAAYLEENGYFAYPPFKVSHITLFSSELGHNGSTYRIEERFELRP